MRKRTINCPENLSRQLALIAAEWGCSSETVIQSFLAAGIATVAQHDTTLRLALMRSAGVDWDTLQAVAKQQHQGELVPR